MVREAIKGWCSDGVDVCECVCDAGGMNQALNI